MELLYILIVFGIVGGILFLKFKDYLREKKELESIKKENEMLFKKGRRG